MTSETDKIVAAILASACLQKSSNLKSAESAVELYHECLEQLAAKQSAIDEAEEARVRAQNERLVD